MKELHFSLNPFKVVVVFGSIAIFLVIANIAGLYVEFILPHPNFFDYIEFYRLVHLGHEQNFPTYFSSLMLLSCSVLALVSGLSVRSCGERDSWYWFGLAVFFLFMSVDEFVCLHEMLIEPIQQYFNTSGYLYYGWVIPYGMIVLVIFCVYVRFLLRLPAKLWRIFFLAGAVYLIGAIGMEMIGGNYSSQFGDYTLTGVFITLCEESLEMAGAILFIYALLRSIEEGIDSISVRTAV